MPVPLMLARAVGEPAPHHAHKPLGRHTVLFWFSLTTLLPSACTEGRLGADLSGGGRQNAGDVDASAVFESNEDESLPLSQSVTEQPSADLPDETFEPMQPHLDASAESPDAGTTEASEECCEPRQVRCGDRCVDLDNDAENCGACGHTCPGALACDGRGRCVAPPGCVAFRRLGHDYFLCKQALSWHAARDACGALGMDLMVLEDSLEGSFVTELLERWVAARPVWLGLNDLERAGVWKWVSLRGDRSVSGEDATFLNWAGGEPNGDDRTCRFGILNPFCRPRNDEDCAVMAPNGEWYDFACTTSHAYACEALPR